MVPCSCGSTHRDLCFHVRWSGGVAWKRKKNVFCKQYALLLRASCTGIVSFSFFFFYVVMFTVSFLFEVWWSKEEEEKKKKENSRLLPWQCDTSSVFFFSPSLFCKGKTNLLFSFFPFLQDQQPSNEHSRFSSAFFFCCCILRSRCLLGLLLNRYNVGSVIPSVVFRMMSFFFFVCVCVKVFLWTNCANEFPPLFFFC